MHSLTVRLVISTVQTLREQREAIKNCGLDLTWIQILDSLSYDIHTMLYHS